MITNSCLRVNWHNVNYDTIRENRKHNLLDDQSIIYRFAIAAARKCYVYSARENAHCMCE